MAADFDKKEIKKMIENKELRYGLGLKVYPRGITQKREHFKLSPCAGSASLKRGKITGFSSASRLRLRRVLLTSKLCGDSAGLFGITLTLPWRDYDVNSVNEEYKKVWNRFQTYYKRKFIYSPLVYRHELQVRGVPHCHAVLYLSARDNVPVDDLSAIFVALWGAAFLWDFRGGSAAGFARRGVVVERLENNIAMYRYISDHTSKRKISQLGYKGKQWGILGGKNLDEIKPIEVEFDDEKQKIRFYRELSKICRFAVKCDCVFGNKRSRRINTFSSARSVQFVAGGEILRLISALKYGIISV